ncbi:MAG TPA: MgtC/SapB family protein, partial [Thermomicrobiales bacterium]|nr:MgtC/SapB family protein [Thermomicrobiales bacterium]
RNSVHGLTTAASLWAVAGIGLASGGGLIWLAVVATGIILAMQAFLRPIEKHYFARPSRSTMTFALQETAGPVGAVLEVVRRNGGVVESVDLKHSRQSGPTQLDLVVSAPRSQTLMAMFEEIARRDGIQGQRFRSHAEERSDDLDDVSQHPMLETKGD